MNTAEHFIYLYNSISDLLLERTGLLNCTSFYELLEIAGNKIPIIRGDKKRLLQRVGDLRNLIVHFPEYPRKFIADPRAEVINQLEKIIDSIKSPMKVVPKFQRKIIPFNTNEHLAEVLK